MPLFVSENQTRSVLSWREAVRARDFARCASYSGERLLMRTVHVFQNFYEKLKEYEESLN